MPKKKEEMDYYFGRVIGEGSFSTVYLARWVLSQLIVLLSWIPNKMNMQKSILTCQLTIT